MTNEKRPRQCSIGSLLFTVTAALGCSYDNVVEYEPGTTDDDDADDEGADDEGADNDRTDGHDESSCRHGEGGEGEDCEKGPSSKCGDGVVQEDEGEVCDDGNNVPGDGCTAFCHLRGTKLAEHTSTRLSMGTAVVVDSKDQLIVSGPSGSNWSLAKFDAAFNMLWEANSLRTGPAGLAVGLNDQVLVTGQRGKKASTKRIDPLTGAEVWSTGLEYEASLFVGVASAGNTIISSGYHDPPFLEQRGVLVRYHPLSGELEIAVGWKDGPLGPVAVDAKRWIWTIDIEKYELLAFDADDEHKMSALLNPGVYKDIAVDQDRNVYVLRHLPAPGAFTLLKYQPDGSSAWPDAHYSDAGASALALAPDGSVIVAGYTLGQSNGLLVWFDGASGEVVEEVIAETEGGNYPYKMFEDVAVAPSGRFAVAVGSRGFAPDETALWIYQVEL